MTISPGDKLGPYEITAAIGKGGMGEVFRARDTRLGRDVAVKVSSEDFGERFEREARAISSLNHSNICTLFDVGPNYLVMELVEGPTLAERIREGAIPLDESLDIARQIANALDAAHDAGIVHRDLKPGNVILKGDGSVKVLDFGLAKMGPRVASSSDGDNPDESPTISMAATQAGVILGTAAYMAPEQARGKPVDKRADIWAFGVVLFEMVTGKRLFAGEDLTDTLARVVRDEVDLSSAPVELQPLLKKCLEKDPRKRLRDISGVDLLLAHGQTESQLRARPVDTNHDAARAASRSRVWPAVAAMAILGAAVLGVGWWRATRPVERPLVITSLDLPGYVSGIFGNLALSADGLRIAYVTREDDGQQRLATRLLAETDVTILEGTEGARGPFFSPTAEWIGFHADGQLKKVLAVGGAPVPLADAPLFGGGSWGEDGLLVASVGGGLMRISESGDDEDLLPPGAGRVLSPQVLPGGRKVIFGWQETGQANEVRILELETKNVSPLIPGTPFAQYLPTSRTTGHLVYFVFLGGSMGGAMMAQPFDPVAGELRGTAIPVLDDGSGRLAFSSAGDVLSTLRTASETSTWPLNWLQPDGTMEPLLETPGNYSYPRVSPDGNSLVVTVDNNSAEAQLLVYDWRNDRPPLELTEKGQVAGGAVWTRDSQSVIWGTPLTAGARRFLGRRADGTGQVHTLVESTSGFPMSISPDGKYLALTANGGTETRLDLWVAPLDFSTPDEIKLGEKEPLVQLPGNQSAAVFSPEGDWVAYTSGESGEREVYVQRFPGGGKGRKVSVGGGGFPRWSSNPRQLLYYENGHIMAVDYQTNGDAFVPNKPREWSATPIFGGSSGDSWDLDPTRDRAVVIPLVDAPAAEGPRKVAYLRHFFDELRRKAPVRK